MFKLRNANRYLVRLLAGLMITASILFFALQSAVSQSQSFI